jgi:hypothetical protein
MKAPSALFSLALIFWFVAPAPMQIGVSSQNEHGVDQAVAGKLS